MYKENWVTTKNAEIENNTRKRKTHQMWAKKKSLFFCISKYASVRQLWEM